MPYTPTNPNRRDRWPQSDCRNHLLATLPADVYERLSPYLRPVELPLEQILYEPHETIHTVYFPNRAMISLVRIMQDGSNIEAGVVGNSGMAGCAVYLGGQSSTSRMIVQMAGEAIALDAAILRTEFKRHTALHDLLLRYSQALIAQISQTAACNRFHSTEERLARWLLQSQDASQSSQLGLTQTFLSNMLGIRRASVTLAAGKLQQAGLIRYSRGTINLLDREGLKSTACECYETVRAEYQRLLSAPTSI